METTSTPYKHCDLIKIDGRIDSETAPQLTAEISNSLEIGHYKLVLDFSAVEYISSAGLRVLINAQKSCRHNNRGEIVLACLQPNVYSALDITGFTSLFKIFDDVLAAVGYF
ncbi:MAG TPA: STAS domain-containing protein [Anaerolineaceae bacterium]|nr:STAS domain-containing protein [Anaerolineaceae bacterium]